MSFVSTQRLAQFWASAKTALSSKDYTASITTSWDGTTAPYTQLVAISGVTAADVPIIDLVVDTTSYDTQEAEWSKIIKAETYAGGIKFYAREKTTVQLTINVKAVR